MGGGEGVDANYERKINNAKRARRREASLSKYKLGILGELFGSRGKSFLRKRKNGFA